MADRIWLLTAAIMLITINVHATQRCSSSSSDCDATTSIDRMTDNLIPAVIRP